MFKDGVVIRSSGKDTKRGYRSSHVQHDKLCYGGFLQSKVLVASLVMEEEEEEEEDDRSKIVPL